MLIVTALLWPGTKVCEALGIDPESDQGLLRSMFNTLIYLTIALIALWLILV